MTSARIQYYWGRDHLLIDLGNRVEPRIRIIYWIELIVTSGIASILLLRSFAAGTSWIQLLAGMAIGAIYFLAGYRFLSRMFWQEQIRVSETHFTILRSTPFRQRSDSFDWKRMGRLRYAAKEPKTDHPLKGNCFDYFGFDTQERLVQDLHHYGNLYFEYEGQPVRFGRNIFSWHAEEIVRMIRLYSGAALRLGAEWQDIMQEMDPME